MAINILDTMTPLWALGAPWVGTAEANVNTRIYRNNVLVDEYEGYGKVKWRSHYIPPGGVEEGFRRAVELAIDDSLAKITHRP